MFTVKVTDEIFHHCQNQVDTHNFGRRSFGNGTKEQQLTGIIGQSVVMEMFGQGYVDGSTGFDGGKDISVLGYSIDVKTMGRKSKVYPSYANNFMAVQKSLNTDIFIFCSLNKTTNELTVCGWIPKAEFLMRATLHKKGSLRYRDDGTSFPLFADMYEISNKELYDVDSPEMLITQIENWCKNKK